MPTLALVMSLNSYSYDTQLIKEGMTTIILKSLKIKAFSPFNKSSYEPIRAEGCRYCQIIRAQNRFVCKPCPSCFQAVTGKATGD